MSPTEASVEPPPAGRRSALPPSAKALVLVAPDDASLLAEVQRGVSEVATTLDLRSGVLWVEVDDARSFLRRVVDLVPARAGAIRIAWAPPDAGVDELLGEALRGVDLVEVGRAIDAAENETSPPAYEVRYQPIVRLDDRTVIGFESLIRARQGGVLLQADDLIERAHRGGWLADFDQSARTLGINGVGPWLGQGLLFLNMMAPDGHFDLDGIQATVRQAANAGLDPDQLVLEAVEANRYTSIAVATRQIEELRSLGVRIAVDDVGDGFASLHLVTSFRPDVVKISGVIINQLPTDGARAVIDAVVSLSHRSGAWVIAENIENEAQATLLAEAGVDWGQGNFLGLPTTRADR